MDKRNFAFVALFSLALIGTNIGFHYWNEQQKQEYRRKLTEYEAHIENQEKARLKALTFTLDRLPKLTPSESPSLRFNDSHFAVYLGEQKPTKSVENLPLFSFQQEPVNCSIYLDSKFEEFTQACRSFSLDSSEKRIVTLTVNTPGNFVRTFPALIHQDMTISSPLKETEGGFNPQNLENGLIWIQYDAYAIPVGYSASDGSKLIAIAFAQFEAFNKVFSQAPALKLSSNEQFFVLENPYMQLVISSKGGGLCEINLPFEGKDSPSVVKESQGDRDILAQSPANANFPLNPAQAVGLDGKAYTLQPKLGGYYPLLRRPIKTTSGSVQPIAKAYETLALVGSYAEISQLDYKLIEQDATHIVLEARDPQRHIRRTYQLPKEPQKEPYVFETTVEVDGDRSNLWLSTGVPEAEVGSASPLPVMKYRLTKGRYSDIENFDVPKTSETLDGVHPDWICNGNSFFAILIDPIDNVFSGIKTDKIEGNLAPSRLTQIDLQWQKHTAEALPGYRMLMQVPNEKAQKLHLRVMAGPLADSVLSQLDETYSDPKTGSNPEYSSTLSFTGWFSFVLRPFSSFMMLLMNLFYAGTHSWVLSIFLLTVALRLMMYPLNAKSNRSMKAMQEIAPKVEALQQRYKNDPQKAQAEIVVLYRENGVNPLSGCLPILIQIPFLFSMLHLFKTNFSLRGASFIPGWIDDLAAPDVLFNWGYPIPFIGSDFHLLPVLLGLTMLAQGMLNSSAKATMNETQRQQKAMNNVMTIAFTFMFYSLPAGLNLYWLFSSLLGIVQQAWQSGRFSAKKHL